MKTRPFASLASIGVALAATTALDISVAYAQTFNVQYNQPTFDRWNYPFSSNPGKEKFAPAFGAIEIPGFDDRDGELLLAFSTAADIPLNLPPDYYHVELVEVTTFVGVDQQFAYDPTFDSIFTLLQNNDPNYVTDTDLGKPVEMFVAGFRNGFSLTTFQETSPFGGQPIVPPAEGARNVFPAVYDNTGTIATDLSRQVRQRFDAQPVAIGQIPADEGVLPGDLVPVGTTVILAGDLCAGGAQAALRQALSQGVVMFIVSSLSPAQGGPDGGTGDPTYPSFYTRENATAIATNKFSRLRLTVTVRNPADFDATGFVDTDDFDAFVRAYEAGDESADIDGSCFVDTDDYDAFIRAYERG
jgi:hypothetical protein